MIDNIGDNYVAHFQDLIDLINDRRCTAFIGSGLTDFAFHNWQDLVDILCDHFRVDKLNSHDRKWAGHLMKKAQECKDGRNGDYFRYLSDIFLEDYGLPSPQCRIIADLPFKGYITLNYDRIFSELLHAEINGSPSLFTCPNLNFSEVIGNSLFHLHGIIKSNVNIDDNNIVVLANTDYQRAYHNPAFISFIEQMLKYRNLLFLCCKITEPCFYHVLYEHGLSFSQDALSKRHYILLPKRVMSKAYEGTYTAFEYNKADLSEDSSYTQFGIQPIRYYKLDDDYRGFINILEFWKQENA